MSLGGTLAIAGSQLQSQDDWTGATYEMNELRAAAERLGLAVVPVPLSTLSFGFEAGRTAVVRCRDRELSSVDYLVVRRTGSFLEQALILTTILSGSGTTCLDPVSRFLLGGASKLLSTSSRHERNVGSTTEVHFDRDTLHCSTLRLSEWLEGGPIVLKPLAGAHGRGFTIVRSAVELEAVVRVVELPVLVQPFESITAEYRVMLLGGRSLATAVKVHEDGAPGNAARGAVFAAVDDETRRQVEAYAESAECPDGLLGVDVIAVGGEYKVIEENFAPEWRSLDRANEASMAAAILDELVRRREGT